MADDRVADTNSGTEGDARIVQISAAELPLHCPLPSAQLWNSHPRVFLAIESTGEVLCPYCGTLYRLSEQRSPGR
jgi:uncharacterized Zn-finger protein